MAAKLLQGMLLKALSVLIIFRLRYSEEPTIELTAALIFDLVRIAIAKWGLSKPNALGLKSFPVLQTALMCFLVKLLYISRIPGAKVEVLYWSVLWRWSYVDINGSDFGLKDTPHAFEVLFGRSARLHGAIAASWISLSFMEEGLGVVHFALLWYHFYRLVRSVVLTAKMTNLDIPPSALAEAKLEMERVADIEKRLADLESKSQAAPSSPTVGDGAMGTTLPDQAQMSEKCKDNSGSGATPVESVDVAVQCESST